MKKHILTLFLCCMVAFLPVAAKAQEVGLPEGQISSIKQGEKAPYAGILLDPVTAAKINTDKKYSLLTSELKLEYETKKIIAEHELKIGLQQTKYDSYKIRTESILVYKNEELNRLQELVKENPNDYTHWWLLGGITIGILTSIAIFYAATEVQN